MPVQLNDFLVASEDKTFDLDHRKKLNFNIGRYNHSVERVKNNTATWNWLKQEPHTLKIR